MKKKTPLIIVILIALVPLVYLTTMYNSLPLVVPTHFSLDGKPDDYNSKGTLVIIIASMSALTIGIYLLLTNIYRIDPKKAVNQSKNTLQKIAFGIVVLISTISIIIIYAGVAKNTTSVERVMLPMLGIFFAYLGNLMHSVKPNYFVGIRTPWALEDEATWRKTHQLAGKLWFAGGILITILAFLLPVKYVFILMIAITVFISIIPAVYSYHYYQSQKKASKNNQI